MTDLPDESPSSRLNRLSVERLRERFGDAAMPELPAEIANAPVRFWMCINPDHRSVVWDGDVATCLDCGVTSDMTARYAKVVRGHERSLIANGFRRQADRYEQAGKAADTLGKQWSGTEQAMHLRHLADCIERQNYEQL